MNLSWTSLLANPNLWIYLSGMSLGISITSSLGRAIRKQKPGIPSLVFLSLAFLSFSLGVLFAPEIVDYSFLLHIWPGLAGAFSAGMLISFFPRTTGTALLLTVSFLYVVMFMAFKTYPCLRIDDKTTSLFVLRMEESVSAVELKQPGFSQVYRVGGETIHLYGYCVSISPFLPFPADKAIFLEYITGSNPDEKQKVVEKDGIELNPLALKVEKLLRQVQILSLFEVSPASRKLHLLKSYKIEGNQDKLEISSLSFSG